MTNFQHPDHGEIERRDKLYLQYGSMSLRDLLDSYKNFVGRNDLKNAEENGRNSDAIVQTIMQVPVLDRLVFWYELYSSLEMKKGNEEEIRRDLNIFGPFVFRLDRKKKELVSRL